MEYLSPGEIIRDRFRKISGMSKTEFAVLTNTNSNTLNKVVAGGTMSKYFLAKISAATSTHYRFWFYAQTEYFFNSYQKSRTHKPIQPIVPKKLNAVIQEHYGKLLLHRYLKLLGMSEQRFAQKIGVAYSKVHRFLIGSGRVNPDLAARLELALGIEIEYWLYTQALFDLYKCRVRYPGTKFIKEIKLSFENENDSCMPHELLTQTLLQHSDIGLDNWRKFLIVNRRVWEQILKGECEISITLFVRLSKLANHSPEDWINHQNAYLLKCANNIKLELQKDIQKVTSYRNELGAIFGFLYPMNWEPTDFGKHVKIKGKKLARMNVGDNRIDFESAIRIGEALGMNPMYFVNLQTERDIAEFESAFFSQNNRYALKALKSFNIPKSL